MRETSAPRRSVVAVNILVVVADRIEPDELLAPISCPLAQVLVEHLLPRRGMQLRGLRQNAIEVEQARGHAGRKTQHDDQSASRGSIGAESWGSSVLLT